MTSKRETVLSALHRLVRTALASSTVTVERGDALPEAIPAGGLVIIRDGKPGEPEYTLSPLIYHYQHAAEIEVFVQSADRDARFDDLCRAIGSAVAADRTLGGLCDWVETSAPEPADLPVAGGATIKAGVVTAILHYSTSDPLN